MAVGAVNGSCVVVLVRWAADTSWRTRTRRTEGPATVTPFARPRYSLPGGGEIVGVPGVFDQLDELVVHTGRVLALQQARGLPARNQGSARPLYGRYLERLPVSL
jgi:hypothetical protein